VKRTVAEYRIVLLHEILAHGLNIADGLIVASLVGRWVAMNEVPCVGVDVDTSVGFDEHVKMRGAIPVELSCDVALCDSSVAGLGRPGEVLEKVCAFEIVRTLWKGEEVTLCFVEMFARHRRVLYEQDAKQQNSLEAERSREKTKSRQ